eukprot:9377007-Ditylum_brightwellii.AAC.1
MASLRRCDDINGEMASLYLHHILFLVCLCKNGCDNDNELFSWSHQSTMDIFEGLEMPDDVHVKIAN